MQLKPGLKRLGDCRDTEKEGKGFEGYLVNHAVTCRVCFVCSNPSRGFEKVGGTTRLQHHNNYKMQRRMVSLGFSQLLKEDTNADRPLAI